jgi:hypothetical protein
MRRRTYTPSEGRDGYSEQRAGSMMTSSRKEFQPRPRIRRSQESEPVKGAREPKKRRRTWRLASSMRYLCLLKDQHAGYHDDQHRMRTNIIHRLPSPARAELIPTFGLLRVEAIRCSSRPSGATDMDDLTDLAIDHCGNVVARNEEVLGITHHRRDALDRTCCVSFSFDFPPRLRHLLLCASRCRSV